MVATFGQVSLGNNDTLDIDVGPNFQIYFVVQKKYKDVQEHLTVIRVTLGENAFGNNLIPNYKYVQLHKFLHHLFPVIVAGRLSVWVFFCFFLCPI